MYFIPRTIISFTLIAISMGNHENPSISDNKIEAMGACDMTRCGAEARIMFRDPMKNEITIKETKAEVTIWPESEEIIFTRRRRFRAYCYQGTILDPNTGCDVSFLEVPIEKEEARQSAADGSCWTGCECSSRVCTGWASDCCNQDKRDTRKGPRKMRETTYESAGLARHSCTSRWSCVVEKVSVKPTLKDNEGRERSVETPDGKILVFNDKFYEEGASFDNSVRYYSTMYKAPTPQMSREKAKCYSSSKDNIRCLIRIRGKEVAIPIDSETLKGRIRGNLIKILEPLETIGEGGKRVKLIPTESNGQERTITKVDITERAASIEDVNELIDGIKTIQMQEISNVINNRNQIIELERVAHKMLVFLSKKYPRLLSSVFGGEYKTKWLNEEIFQVCPCNKMPTIPPFSNCAGNLMYFEGELKKAESISMCHSFLESNVRNISLTNATDSLDTELIDYLPPKTSSSEDPSWDWLMDLRSRVDDFKTPDVDYDKINGYLDGLMPWFSWKNVMIGFSFMVSLLWLIEKIITVRSR